MHCAMCLVIHIYYVSRSLNRCLKSPYLYYPINGTLQVCVHQESSTVYLFNITQLFLYAKMETKCSVDAGYDRTNNCLFNG